MSGRGINKVIIIGNVGATPDVRQTPSGLAVATISLATSESWKDKSSGEQQKRTEWHRVVAFGRTAEIIGEYVRKGSKLYVEGALRTRKWDDKSGVERYTTEIVANDIQMLDSRGDAQSGFAYDDQQVAEATPAMTQDQGIQDEDIPF